MNCKYLIVTPNPLTRKNETNNPLPPAFCAIRNKTARKGEIFLVTNWAIVTARLMRPPLRWQIVIARVAMLRPKHNEMCSIEGGLLGFHVTAEPIPRNTNKKVARNSAKVPIQRLFFRNSCTKPTIAHWIWSTDNHKLWKSRESHRFQLLTWKKEPTKQAPTRKTVFIKAIVKRVSHYDIDLWINGQLFFDFTCRLILIDAKRMHDYGARVSIQFKTFNDLYSGFWFDLRVRVWLQKYEYDFVAFELVMFTTWSSAILVIHAFLQRNTSNEIPKCKKNIPQIAMAQIFSIFVDSFCPSVFQLFDPSSTYATLDFAKHVYAPRLSTCFRPRSNGTHNYCKAETKIYQKRKCLQVTMTDYDSNLEIEHSRRTFQQICL